MSFPIYRDRKPTGNPALPVVPSHWEVRRLAHCGTFLKGSGGSKEDIVDDGLPCVRYGDLYTTHSFFIEQSRTRIAREVASAYTPIHYGDVLFAASGETFEEIGKSAVNLIDGDAFCGGDIVILRPGIAADARFLGYAVDSRHAAAQKASMGRGTTVKHIYPDQLKQVVIALPPTADQRAIAAFLDRETAKIDALVAEQERLIELLKEKRQAVISHAVTKGLNPHAAMKPSGIEWVGDAPAHWKTCLLKRAFATVDYGVSDALETEGTVAILRMGNISDGAVVMDDLKYLDAVDSSLILRRGDLLYNRTNSLDLIGKVGMFDADSDSPFSFASYLVRMRTTGEGVPKFFAYLLNTEGILGLARASAFVAIGQCNLNPTRYGQLTVALPPVNEQTAIVEFLDEETAKLDALIGDARRAINLLQERRSALTSAAVTGQIDVRGLVNPEAA